MKILTLIAVLFGLSFIFVSPTHAQDGNDLAPCLPAEAATMIWQQFDEQPVRLFNPDELTLIEGTQVVWLGYAGDSAYANELEMQGVVAGFKGINLRNLVPIGAFWLEVDYNEFIGRITISDYGDQYFITATTMHAFAVKGSYRDYHILPHPDGGACMWLVDKTELEFFEEFFL